MHLQGERHADYLHTAEEAWAFLSAHNARAPERRRENIVDDYCALLAATELYARHGPAAYKVAADQRASRLLARLPDSGRARTGAPTITTARSSTPPTQACPSSA